MKVLKFLFNKKKIQTLLVFYFLNCISIFSIDYNVQGWSLPKRIDSNVLSYSVYAGSGSLARSGLASEKKIGNNHTISFYLFGNNGIISSKILKSYKDDSEQPGVAYPTVAIYGNKAMVAWQNIKGADTHIEYVYIAIDSGKILSSKVRQLETNGTALLPILNVDGLGNFLLVFQEKSQGENFSLSLSRSNKEGIFEAGTPVVTDLSSVGRGIFFPSVLQHNGKIEIFFQKRYRDTLKDNIYRIEASVSNFSFSDRFAITENQYNDFSPYAFITPDGTELVWQSSPDNSWQIWHAKPNGEKKRINANKANAYQASAVYLPETGRIIAWTDFRDSQPKVYSVFIDLPDNVYAAKPRNLSINNGNNPRLIRIRNNGYIFYQSNGLLFFRKVDHYTPPIFVSLNGSIQSGGVKLSWRVPEKEKSIEKFAYIVDQNESTDPGIYNIMGNQRSMELHNLTSGIYWFHIKYLDKTGISSQVEHFAFAYDAIKNKAIRKYQKRKLDRYRKDLLPIKMEKPKIKTKLENNILAFTVEPEGTPFYWEKSSRAQFPVEKKKVIRGAQRIVVSPGSEFFINIAWENSKDDFVSKKIIIPTTEKSKNIIADRKFFDFFILFLIFILGTMAVIKRRQIAWWLSSWRRR